MKKIFILSFFLSFANILLGQISLTVKRMQFVKENQLDWKKRKRSVKVLFNKKDDEVIIAQSAVGGAFGGKEDYPTVISGHAGLLSLKSSNEPCTATNEKMENNEVSAT